MQSADYQQMSMQSAISQHYDHFTSILKGLCTFLVLYGKEDRYQTHRQLSEISNYKIKTHQKKNDHSFITTKLFVNCVDHSKQISFFLTIRDQN